MTIVFVPYLYLVVELTVTRGLHFRDFHHCEAIFQFIHYQTREKMY